MPPQPPSQPAIGRHIDPDHQREIFNLIRVLAAPAKHKRISPDHEGSDLEEEGEVEEQEPRPYQVLDEGQKRHDAEVVVVVGVSLTEDEYEDFDGVNCVTDDEGEVEVVEGDDGANVRCWVRRVMDDASRRHVVIFFDMQRSVYEYPGMRCFLLWMLNAARFGVL